MVGLDESLYSIFSALKHNVRREILLKLSEEAKSFTDLYETLGISSSHLSYHLIALDGLVQKRGSKYQITDSGKKAVNMIEMTLPPLVMKPVSSIIFKYIAGILLLLIIGMINVYIRDYQVNFEIIKSGFFDTIYFFILPIYPALAVLFGCEYWKSVTYRRDYSNKTLHLPLL